MAKKNDTSKKRDPDRKYSKCEKCGLNIRCGNVEAHENGWHHKNKGYKKI